MVTIPPSSDPFFKGLPKHEFFKKINDSLNWFKQFKGEYEKLEKLENFKELKGKIEKYADSSSEITESEIIKIKEMIKKLGLYLKNNKTDQEDSKPRTLIKLPDELKRKIGQFTSPVPISNSTRGILDGSLVTKSRTVLGAPNSEEISVEQENKLKEDAKIVVFAEKKFLDFIIKKYGKKIWIQEQDVKKLKELQHSNKFNLADFEKILKNTKDCQNKVFVLQIDEMDINGKDLIPKDSNEDLVKEKKGFFPKLVLLFLNLKSLTLRNLQLEEIPKEIVNLKELRKLDLYGNKFDALPNSVCELSKLQELILSDNPIKSLPKELINLKKLGIIEFSRREIFDNLDEASRKILLDMQDNQGLWIKFRFPN